MCGIVYVKRLDNAHAQKQALKRYSKQQHRGSEGFGYIGVKSNGTISPLQRTQFEHEIRTKLKASTLTEILFHHRYPTSTPNVPESAHPIFVGHRELKHNYFVVHNGVLSNDDELHEAHLKLGYRYNTEVKTQYRTKKGHVYTSEVVYNDSESLAIELARTIEGLQPQCNAKGSIAYIAYQVDKVSGKVLGVYFGRNEGNPLMVQKTDQYIVIASEGAGAKTLADKSYKIDPNTNECLEVDVKLHSYYIPPRSAVGYHRTDSTYRDSFVMPTGKNETVYLSDLGNYGNRALTDEEMSLPELEEEMQLVDDDIIGTSGDVLYAQNEGDTEAQAQYEQDYNNLMTRRNKLQKLYEQKALTTA